MKHKQLTFEQRYVIEHMLKEKHSKKSIITTLGLVESTFYREFKRNSKKSVFNAHYANMLAEERRKTGHYKTIFTSRMELDNASIQDNLLVMSKLNSRPRKINGFKTPNYLFSKYIYENKLAFSS